MKKASIIRFLLPLLLPFFLAFTQKDLKRLMKNWEQYAFIPSESPGDNIGFTYLHMAKHEVTNLAYDEFLGFLEKEGRKEDLAKARIRNENWKTPNSYNEVLADVYHEYPAYDHYPVVNISHEAAKLYCEWLTLWINKDPMAQNFKKIYFRLPTKQEWIRAARGGHKDAPYPWGGYGLRNAKGEWLANFKRIGAESITFNTVSQKFEVVSQGIHSNPGTTAGRQIGPATVDSYIESDYQLFHMAGNVAEMVQEDGIAMGGSWNSPGFDIQTTSEFKYEKPSPYVGFRPVLVIED